MSRDDIRNIVVLGSAGAIGQEFAAQLSQHYARATIHAFSQRPQNLDHANIKTGHIDYLDEASIEYAAQEASKASAIDMIIVATGLLHGDGLMPEKSLRDLSAQNFERLFAANTIFPALAAKHFLPHIHKDKRAVFAALSARVGSISDNRLGGWYAYRASKAALNMMIKNAAIEIGRRFKHSIIIGLHPGTVDSGLSKPFQGNVAEGKLFTPAHSVSQLISVIDKKTPEDSGKCFDWGGTEIDP